MSKDWFSAAELLAMPGMPGSVQGVRYKAANANWLSRKRPTGKGNEYHINSLPLETRQHVAKQAALAIAQADTDVARSARQVASEMERKELVTAQQVKEIKESGTARFNGLSEKAQRRVQAKVLILQTYQAYIAPYRVARQEQKGLNTFVSEFNQRQLELPEWVYGQIKKLSKNFKYRWKAVLDNGGLAALAGNYGKTKGRSVIGLQPQIEQFLMALLTRKPHLAHKNKDIHQTLLIMQEMDYPHWQIPSISSVERWVKNWLAKHSAEFSYVTNPDAYNSKHRPLFGRMYMYQQLEQPNDIWEFDSTPVDAMLKDGRHSIIAVIDVFTRRVRLWVAPTSSSEGICLLLRKTILDWGMLNPGGLAVTDNGSDYVSKKVSGLFGLLEFQQHQTTPYSGWEKPAIERFFRTLSHSIVEKLPGYIGHNVADRKQIEAARSFAERIAKKEGDEKEIALQLTGAELQQFLDDWLEYHYHHKVHSELDTTPFQAYQNSGYQPRTVSNPDALNLLLNFVGEATVIRGGVKAGSVKYVAPELMEAVWDRAKVRVFVDPSDVGRAVLYPIDLIIEGDSSWIEAINQELIGREISPEEFQSRRKAEQKVLRKFRKTSKELVEVFGIDDIHAKELAYYKAKNGNLTAFPQPTLPHENGMLADLDSFKPTSSRSESPAQYSDEELAALEARREKRHEQQAMLAQESAQGMRTEQEQAWHIAKKSIHTEITEKEAKWFKGFMRSHVLAARRINKYLEEARQQQSSQAN